MDIILEFYIRNHSGIDLHDTDIDFSEPVILKKKNSLSDLLYVNETVLFIIRGQSDIRNRGRELT